MLKPDLHTLNATTENTIVSCKVQPYVSTLTNPIVHAHAAAPHVSTHPTQLQGALRNGSAIACVPCTSWFPAGHTCCCCI
jgi:hypothetical protein